MKKKSWGLAAKLIRMIIIIIVAMTAVVTLVFGLRAKHLELAAEKEGKEIAEQVTQMNRAGVYKIIRDGIEKRDKGELDAEELFTELMQYGMSVAVIQGLQTAELISEMKNRIQSSYRTNILFVIAVASGLTILSALTASRLSKKRVDPINHMTRRIKELSGDNAVFEMEEVYKTGDEIEALAEAFTDQTAKLKDYVEKNLRITLEKEKLDTELALASQIQESMLPRSFPAFPGRREFDLFARMVPAKTVGGDFYDFFLVDEDHLAVVIADVSEKGIAAALFMALSKQVLQSRLMLYRDDVKKALEEANRLLCKESVEDMFVTAWIGVLCLSDGRLVFVDAGHDLAAVSRGNGDFTLLEDNHGIILAAFPEWEYQTSELLLRPGDKVFLYTDGVTEARNGRGEMLEESGMLRALNEDPSLTPRELDERVRSRIAAFVGEEEQYDDITTLCLQYFGKGE